MLEAQLELTPREKRILSKVFSLYQESILRLYEQNTEFLEPDNPFILEIMKSYDFQCQLSEDFLRAQEYMENPDTLKKANRVDMAIIREYLFAYFSDLSQKYGHDEVQDLLEKMLNLNITLNGLTLNDQN